MNFRSMISDVTRLFRQNLEELLRDNAPGEWDSRRFTDFVAGLKAAVNEAGRVVLEEAIAAAEVVGELIEYEGREYRFKQGAMKTWLSPFGRVSVERRYYRPVGGRGEGVCPIDIRCGMEDRFLMPDVEELVTYGSAHMVPSEVSRYLSKILPEAPSSTAIQRSLKDVGNFLAEQEEAIEERISQEAPLSSEGDALVVSMDGVTVPVREAGRKRGRPAERPGVRDDDESRISWREAGVGTVSVYQSPERKDERPICVDKRYFARMPEPHMSGLFARQGQVLEEILRDYSFSEKAVICDGKRSLWDSVDEIKCLEGAVRILDFYHAAEHLSKASEALFGKKSESGKRWYTKYRAKLRDEDGGITAVIRSIRYYTKELSPRSARLKDAKRELSYFVRNREKMDYASYRRRGLPIGSGPVEAACKTVVGARLKRSGMMWSNEGGQQILDIRTLVLSDRWDVAWQEYLDSRIGCVAA